MNSAHDNNELQTCATPRERIDSLIAEFSGDNGIERQRARRALVKIGEPAVPMLIDALASKHQMVRWEAAKSLTQIHSPDSAPALVNALEHGDWDVRWLAAEALIGLGAASLRPLLEALTKRAGSVWLRKGAHHVLNGLKQEGLAPIVAPVLRCLDQQGNIVTVAVKAEEALNRL